MSDKVIKDIVSSVHQRLLNLDPERKIDFTITLTRYAVERWLYRLSRSPHKDSFLLKGAMLFLIWSNDRLRTTRDLDLLGFGDFSPENLQEIFFDICRTEVEPDGLSFDLETFNADPIRVEDEYQGHRIRIVARIGRINIPMQLDIGIGDSVWPEPEEVEFPTLLGMPAPLIKAYKKETVIAEKLQAMFALGILNSRMKDFYDIMFLSESFPFKGEMLYQASKETFKRRNMTVPNKIPLVFSAEFSENDEKKVQWNAFVKRILLKESALNFADVVGKIKSFLLPVITAMGSGEDFTSYWPPGGPWRK